MELSGVIFVVLALAWAVFLIPMALKHHDEVARTRSIDRFSSTMRVLARREPVDSRNARLVVTPARGADNPRLIVPAVPPVTRRQLQAHRRAAAAAARRRRTILVLLFAVNLVIASLSYLDVLLPWAPAIPAAATLVYLVLCRVLVRRERAAWDRLTLPATEVAAEVGVAVRLDPEDAEETVSIEVGEVAAQALAEADGSLWDPLPMTLPTYVGKPRAARTVRTIDLGEPGAWTSGRDAADSQLVAEAEAKAAGDSTDDGQRAVGS